MDFKLCYRPNLIASYYFYLYLKNNMDKEFIVDKMVNIETNQLKENIGIYNFNVIKRQSKIYMNKNQRDSLVVILSVSYKFIDYCLKMSEEELKVKVEELDNLKKSLSKNCPAYINLIRVEREVDLNNFDRIYYINLWNKSIEYNINLSNRSVYYISDYKKLKRYDNVGNKNLFDLYNNTYGITLNTYLKMLKDNIRVLNETLSLENITDKELLKVLSLNDSESLGEKYLFFGVDSSVLSDFPDLSNLYKKIGDSYFPSELLIEYFLSFNCMKSNMIPVFYERGGEKLDLLVLQYRSEFLSKYVDVIA